MLLVSRNFALAIGALAVIAVIGCGAKPDAAMEAGHEGHDHSEHASTDGEIDLSYLSAEDQEAARKQKFCPVGGTDALLGTPGMTAVKVSVEGRDVFLCCEGCEGDLRDDPQKYFAILDGKAGEDSAPADDAKEEAPEAEAETNDPS